jgi:AcrR family transcriptional regulator
VTPERPAAGAQRRRSQSERRAETVELLLDATITAINDIGYHGATVAEICRRAGVTDGALFHHFDTRVDLVLQALERMTEERITRYVEYADTIRAGGGNALDLLTMVGRLARDDVAVVWAEITIAARTDAELRERVGPAIEARWALIRAAASSFPAIAAMEATRRDTWMQLMRGTIELAPVIEPVVDGGAHEERDTRRNRALLNLATHYGARFTAG